MSENPSTPAMPSRFRLSLSAAFASLCMPMLACAQDAATQPAPIVASPLDAGMNPFTSPTLYTSAAWWITLALGSIVGLLILQKFLKK